MAQLVELLDVQLRNLTPGGKDSAARSLAKVIELKVLNWNKYNFAWEYCTQKHALLETNAELCFML